MLVLALGLTFIIILLIDQFGNLVSFIFAFIPATKSEHRLETTGKVSV